MVTAFIIESYIGLQEDPTERLLSQLVAIMNSTAGGATAPTSLPTPMQTPFPPTSTTTLANILWFLSLVFSITTAVIGIVSLQWIRENQGPAQGLTGRFEGTSSYTCRISRQVLCTSDNIDTPRPSPRRPRPLPHWPNRFPLGH